MISLLTKVFTIKNEIEEALGSSFQEKTKLHEAITYALTTGGKRVRPMIVYFIADALGNNLDVKEAALATEFFHTASLIADDLPCMDNENLRRSKPTLHKVFGESTALLASYGLIAEAFRKIYENGRVMENGREPFASNAKEATLIALECASRCSGTNGATLGQFFDLNPISDDLNFIDKVIYLKTITLFEGAFVMGWIFGGGDKDRLESVKKLAYHFGMAFQIRDDLSDMKEDLKKEKHVNLANSLGREMAERRFAEEMNEAETLLKELSLYTGHFEMIMKKLRPVC